MSDHPANAVCPECARLAQRLAIAWAASLALVAAWFLVRRLAGAFGAAPSELALLATALVLTGSSLAVRRLCRLDSQFPTSNIGRAVWLAPGIAWLLVGLAFATFAASGLGFAVFWIAFALSEGEAWLREGRAVLSPWLALATPLAPAALAVTPPAAPIAPPLAVNEGAAELPAGVMLQLTRQQMTEGELVFGSARAIFEPGQRVATVHVSFGAPLARVPEVLAEAQGDEEVEIECAQALAHGVRFDLRLRRAATERTEIVFAFEAHSGTAASEAA